MHCGVCKGYLKQFSESIDAFKSIVVDIVFVSSDTEYKARKVAEEWSDQKLDICFGLDESTGKQLGLWLSEATNDKQPPRYFEPGLYLIKLDGELI